MVSQLADLTLKKQLTKRPLHLKHQKLQNQQLLQKRSRVHAQLGEIKYGLKKNIKGDDVKKLIKGIVEELFQKHQEKIEQKYDEKF